MFKKKKKKTGSDTLFICSVLTHLQLVNIAFVFAVYKNILGDCNVT